MVINTGDVRYLLVLDNYDDLPEYDIDHLTVIWFNIYNEFSESVGGNRSGLYIVKQKRLITMKLRFQIDASLLNVLREIQHEDLIEMAREAGYDIDADNFDVSYKKAFAQLMKLKHQISTVEKETNIEQTNEKADFDNLIIILEKFMGYQFVEREMTVKKFANIYKLYKDAGKQD